PRRETDQSGYWAGESWLPLKSPEEGQTRQNVPPQTLDVEKFGRSLTRPTGTLPAGARELNSVILWPQFRMRFLVEILESGVGVTDGKGGKPVNSGAARSKMASTSRTVSSVCSTSCIRFSSCKLTSCGSRTVTDWSRIKANTSSIALH